MLAHSASTSSPRTQLQPRIHTIRSLTGADIIPSPSSSPASPDKRYSRQNILIFRSAAGEECPLHILNEPPESPQPKLKARISSVTDSSPNSPTCSPICSSTCSSTCSPSRSSSRSTSRSPSRSSEHLDTPHIQDCLPDAEATPLSSFYYDDDSGSTYSHASAINLDGLAHDDINTFTPSQFDEQSDIATPQSRGIRRLRRQTLARSIAKARNPNDSKALVLARPEVQPQNASVCLLERCVSALTEALDMNLLYAGVAIDKFHTFTSFYTTEERQVISDLLKEASARLRTEAPTPWRSPLRTGKKVVITHDVPRSQSANQLPSLLRAGWAKRHTKTVSCDTLVRSVVFGLHVIPGVQSAESILLRMAGEYHREAVTRKASRSQRIDIPLSFALTLTAVLATFSRLECNVSYRRFRFRTASNRRGNPHGVVLIKTRYDGLKLSFAITLQGESPCTILFRRPKLISARKTEEFTALVTEAKDILSEFGREVTGNVDL